LTGFGASAHLVLKMVGYAYPAARVAVFARSEAASADLPWIWGLPGPATRTRLRPGPWMR
jgi:hypothetical protein